MKFLPCICLGVCLSVSVMAQEPTFTEAELDVIEAQMIGDADIVTLDVDAALWEDDEIMVALLSAVPDGEVPRNVRKIVAGVVGEMQVALGKRIQGGNLLLDDGSLVSTSSGKKKAARKKKTHGATVVWNPGETGQPSRIIIRNGQGQVRCLSFPDPGQGAPTMGNKCAVK